jgi:hypothetical protein
VERISIPLEDWDNAWVIVSRQTFVSHSIDAKELDVDSRVTTYTDTDREMMGFTPFYGYPFVEWTDDLGEEDW